MLGVQSPKHNNEVMVMEQQAIVSSEILKKRTQCFDSFGWFCYELQNLFMYRLVSLLLCRCFTAFRQFSGNVNLSKLFLVKPPRQ